MAVKNLPGYKELLASWLKNGEYDGLYCPGECACEPGDLAPCDMTPAEIECECHPGYRVEGCDGNCAAGGGCDYHIQGEKPDNTTTVKPSIGEKLDETCNRDGCKGTIHLWPIGDCSCHTGNPPCSRCSDPVACCDTCGWEAE